MNRRLALTAAIVIAAGGITVAVISQAGASPKPAIAPALADPPGPNDLYVSNTTCGGTATGSLTAPFCTISAAAAVAQPGQTVHIEPGNAYDTRVVFTHSGTTGNPITFTAETYGTGRVVVGDATVGQPAGNSPVDIENVHDIVIRGLAVQANSAAPTVEINNSSDITVDGGSVKTISSSEPSIEVTGASDTVTVSREFIEAAGDGIDVTGSTNVVVAANQIATLAIPTLPATAVNVATSPGIDIVNDTLWTNCHTAVAITGASGGASIENNVVQAGQGPLKAATVCAAASQPTAISIATAALGGTTTDYNLVDTVYGGPVYGWGATTYANPAALQAVVTTQAKHDLTGSVPFSALSGSSDLSYIAAVPTAAIDSGDRNAPGALPTDMVGNAHQDNPAVSNTGTGNGYADRGAIEGIGSFGQTNSLVRSAAGGPLGLVASVAVSHGWASDGQFGSLAYRVPGRAFPIITTDATVDLTAPKAGLICVTTGFSADGFRGNSGTGDSTCAVAGSYYTPLAPKRVLDTRNAIGVSTKAPVAPRGTITVPVAGITSVPLANLTAIVMNVTVTRPTKSGYLTAYTGSIRPTASNLNFVANQSIPNLVTLPVIDGNVHIYNGSDGSAHIIADFVGYYGPGGYGFKPMTAPVRVLDTRHAVGIVSSTPIAGATTVTLNISAKLPAGATAAVLNVTAAQATQSGFVTVYPFGQAAPNASNLNYQHNQTVANLVIVPVTNGKVNITNTSAGTVHLIADLAGYYGTDASGARQSFVPNGPLRIADTRQSSTPVPANSAIGEFAIVAAPAGTAVVPAASVLYNITAVTPSANGWLTVYPSNQPRPNASNLNFAAHVTVPNLVIVGNTPTITIYNASPGATNVIVDEEGYFIAPA